MNSNFTPNLSGINQLNLNWSHLAKRVQVSVFGAPIALSKASFFVHHHDCGEAAIFLSVPYGDVLQHFFHVSDQKTNHLQLGMVHSVDFLRNRIWKENIAFLYQDEGPYRSTSYLVFPIEHVEIE